MRQNYEKRMLHFNVGKEGERGPRWTYVLTWFVVLGVLWLRCPTCLPIAPDLEGKRGV